MKKYNFKADTIKANIRKVRKERNLTQKEVAVGIDLDNSTRTVITNWENVNNKALPDIAMLMSLCNYFECDLDYIVGATDIKSKNINEISSTLNISEKSVATLMKEQALGSFINNIISDKECLTEIANRTKQLSYNYMLKDVLDTSFTIEFSNKIKNHFNDFYFSCFPMDVSSDAFKIYLKKCIPNTNFDCMKFLNDNFLDDGKLFIFNSTKNFLTLSNEKQYEIIISSIVDITYDYNISHHIVELSKQKLNALLSEFIDNAIIKEANSIKERIKKGI